MGRRQYLSLFAMAMSAVAVCQTTDHARRAIHPAIPSTAMNEVIPGRLVVKLKPRALSNSNGVTPAAVQRSSDVVSRISQELGGGEYVADLGHSGWTRWTIPLNADPRTLAKEILQDPDVIYAEPENRVYAVGLPVPNDPDWSVIENRSTYAFSIGSSSSSGSNTGTADFRRLWNLWDTNAVTSDAGGVVSGGWALFPGKWYTASSKPSDCPIIALVDTGVDMDHPDFINAGGSSSDSAHGGQLMKSLSGYFQDGVLVPGGDPTDQNGHGTHVAGIALAAGNNGGFDGDGVIGIGYNSRGMVLRVFDSQGNASDIDAAGAIYYAADNGAAIINLSLGTTNYSQVFQDAVTYAWQKGSLVVCAGNENGSAGGDLGPIYPAACSGALAVTANAPGQYPADDYYAGYGNYVGIAAPGGDLVEHSTTSFSLQYVFSTATRYDCTLSQSSAVQPPYTLDYTYLVGTSMACPHVSGAAGLYYGQNNMHQSDGFANVRAYQALQCSALGTAGAANGGWEPTQGYGSLDVQGLLSLSKAPNPRSATVGDVTGIVYYGGTPIPNVRVTATSVGGAHKVYNTTSFSDGTFRFDAFPAGIYDIKANPFGSAKTKRVQISAGCDFPGVDFFCGPLLGDTTPPVIQRFSFLSQTPTSLDVYQWAYDTETEIDSATVQIGSHLGASDVLPQTLILPGTGHLHLTGFSMPAKYVALFTYINGDQLVSHATREALTDLLDATVSDASPSTDTLGQTFTVSTGATGHNRVEYMTLDLRGINKTLTDGYLCLYGGATGAAVNIGVYGAAGSFSESSLNWNNRPKLLTSYGTTRMVGANQAYTFDVSGLVRTALKAGQQSITIAIKCLSTSSTGATFTTRRGSASLSPALQTDSHD